MNRLIGRALIATGIGHTVVGLVLFREPLAAIWRDGVANTIRDGQYDREAAFWFLLFSPLCVLLGQLVDHATARRDRWLLALVGWNVLAIGAVGALMMPVSGFWILLVLAPLVLRVARRIDAGGAPAAQAAPGRA